MNILTKDTVLCISLAARPSNIGTRFHNFLYSELGLDYVYKAFTTSDLTAAIGGIRALGIRGAGISMPYKEDCLALVDEVTASASAISSVNTIVNTDGYLVAYNTDYVAVAQLLLSRGVASSTSAVVLGSGGMAKAVVAALRDGGFRDVTVVARNLAAGTALAEQYGFTHRESFGDLRPGLIVNATPMGMAGGPASDTLAAPAEAIAAAEVVFDVVAMPVRTPLIVAAEAAGRTVITGAEVIALQAAEQFELYTGVRPTPDQVARASEYSRAQ